MFSVYFENIQRFQVAFDYNIDYNFVDYYDNVEDNLDYGKLDILGYFVKVYSVNSQVGSYNL